MNVAKETLTPCWTTLGVVTAVGVILSLISGPLTRTVSVVRERRITTMTTLYVLILFMFHQIPSWHFHKLDGTPTESRGWAMPRSNVYVQGNCFTDFKRGYNIFYAVFMIMVGYLSFYIFASDKEEDWNISLGGFELDLTVITMLLSFVLAWIFVPLKLGGYGLYSKLSG